MTQPALIPGIEPDPLKRGRGATAVYHRSHRLPQPNPTGCITLTIKYRPLDRYDHATLSIAEDLAIDYFTKVGGYATADDAVIRCFYDAIEKYTAAGVRCAIDAKAFSLLPDDQHDAKAKAKFRGRPEKFFASIEHWLGRSSEWLSRKRDRSRRDRQATAAVALNRKIEARDRAAMGEHREQLRTSARVAHADDRRRQELRQSRLATWRSLPESTRQLLLSEVRPEFEKYCLQSGLDPSSKDQQERLFEVCVEKHRFRSLARQEAAR